MRFNDATIRVLVQKGYGECFDFYTKKLGLIPVWGDREGPYTSFATGEGEPPCFAIFSAKNMCDFQGYEPPHGSGKIDGIVAIIPTNDLDGDYQRLSKAGVQFISEPRLMEGWGMRCTYFRDPQGNLFELNDAGSI